MSDTANVIMSAELAQMVSNPVKVETLMHGLGMPEYAAQQGISMSGDNVASKNRPIDRDIVQGWFDNGQLQLKEEPPSALTRRLFGSPTTFLKKHGLTTPKAE